ncbi:SWPV2-ORF241 [Shearwaterpox virus]|uniref:SWPV2-ORF241 n=1 Tax=Shearwaterpox virus TaxID=1974596 RepID=A0A1V0QGM0_CNPV|nr:SWPV2-ORF241 [Shearwaterpox virus]QRM15534.1 putative myristylated protein [Mudlarkpox virus]QRM15887.1 putative myristylated protein [Penguinpox virus 2]QRM16224.1 putative myristylated protein [Albatrosspox virus]
MGQRVSSITVENTRNPEIKYLKVSYSGGYQDEFIKFQEANRIRESVFANEVSIPFCLTQDTTVKQCASFLSPDARKKFVIAPGVPCKSLSFRPGSIVDVTKIPYGAESYILEGTTCRFINKDFLYTDPDIKRCCNKESSIDCPKIFSNNYETDHCDTIMSSICLQTPESIPCREWLATKREIPLDTYMKVCSDHLDENYCSDFVDYTRPDNFGYSDTAILSYCAKHKSNPNCWCVTTPQNDKLFSLELALGPKVCWLHECTDKSRDRKYLLFDQDIQRARCKYIGCNINVETLRLTNSVAELIANCGGAISDTLVTSNDDDYKDKTIPNFFSILPISIVIILLFILFYFLKVYNSKLINSNTINVYRK